MEIVIDTFKLMITKKMCMLHLYAVYAGVPRETYHPM